MAYFLSKGGTKFGPFTDAQLDELKAKGEFLTYSFFWDDAKPGWQPIDMPPEAPSEGEAPMAASPKAVAKVRAIETAPRLERVINRAPTRETRYYETALKAVCLDHEHAMTAVLSKANEEGCELSADHPEAAPQFVVNGRAMLNLFDEKSGKSVNVPVQIAKVSRQDGVWKYRLNWDTCPDLIAAA